MAKYLITSKNKVAFNDSSYPGRIKLNEGDLYVNSQSIRKTEQPWHKTLGINEFHEFRSPSEAKAFDTMLSAWKGNSLELYRGITGCHFNWPALMNGELRSEGDNDYPTYTMYGEETCWLPSDMVVGLAQSAGDTCTDEFSVALSMKEPIASAIAVSVNCGINSGRTICWLNEGEIAIRGPLRIGEYRMHSIMWRYHGLGEWHRWPHALVDVPSLPAQRPYKPSSPKQIEDWWGKCQRWADGIAQFDPVLANRRDLARKEAEAMRQSQEGTSS